MSISCGQHVVCCRYDQGLLMRIRVERLSLEPISSSLDLMAELEVINLLLPDSRRKMSHPNDRAMVHQTEIRTVLLSILVDHQSVVD